MKNYPKHYKELIELMGKMGKEIPETMKGFGAIHHTNATDSALTAKTKELIALGIAICVRCDGCIAFHVHDSLKAKATKAEIMETISVAILMGGGPSVMYGCEALEALQQFETEMAVSPV